MDESNLPSKSTEVKVNGNPSLAEDNDSDMANNEEPDGLEYDSLEQPDDSITQEVVRNRDLSLEPSLSGSMDGCTVL